MKLIVWDAAEAEIAAASAKNTGEMIRLDLVNITPLYFKNVTCLEPIHPDVSVATILSVWLPLASDDTFRL